MDANLTGPVKNSNRSEFYLSKRIFSDSSCAIAVSIFLGVALHPRTLPCQVGDFRGLILKRAVTTDSPWLIRGSI